MSTQMTTSQTRSFSLGLYLFIVFGLSWPFQFASALWGGSNLLPVYVLNATSMLMVTVGTFIVGRYVFRDGFAGAGWSWGKPRYYLAVIGLALLLWVVPTFIDLALKHVRLPGHITPTQLVWVFVLLFVTLLPGFGEEFGWRGYMLAHLAQRMSERKAVLLHAVIWWTWHLPILVGAAVASAKMAALPGSPLSETQWSAFRFILVTAVIVILSAVPTILHGVVFAYIWSRGRSLAVSSVYHAAFDGLRDSLGLTIGLGPVAGIWANLVLIILSIVLLWRGSWSNLKANTTVPEPESLEAKMQDVGPVKV